MKRYDKTVNTVPRKYLRLNDNSFPFCLWRLSDEEFNLLRLCSFPIQANDLFIFNLEIEQRNKPNELTLPKALLVLEENFGESSTALDSWKQTFSFPLLLAVEKLDNLFYYLLKINDYRGGLEFRFCRVIDDLKFSSKNVQVYHPPIADELSGEEINYIIAYLWGFMQGYSKSLGIHQPIQPFFRHVDSSHIIYGFWNGKFVEEVIEDLEQYQQMVQSLKTQYDPEPSEQEQVNQTQALIQAIAQTSQES